MRLSVERGRVEVHHLPGDELKIGRGPECGLVLLEGEAVGERHARILSRRGLLVLVDLESGKGTQVRGESIRAPVVLAPGEPFCIGTYVLRAWPEAPDEPRPGDLYVGGDSQGEPLGVETPTVFSDLRVFRRQSDGGLTIWTLPARPEAESRVKPWIERVRRSADRASAYLPELNSVGEVRGVPCVKERLPLSVSLSEAERALDQGQLRPAPALVYALSAQILEAVSAFHEAFGPHGAISPEAFLLGLDGRLILRRPGPEPGELDDPARRVYLSPARRCGEPPSLMDDRFSLSALSWLGRLIPAGSLVGSPLLEIAAGLREGAVEGGLDPSAGQLAHLARLLYREPPALARVSIRGG